jgi:hypothetical protein
MFLRISACNRFLINSCLGIIIFTTACGPAPSANIIAAAQPTCIPSTPETNPYLYHPLSATAKNIYLNSFTNLSGARQEALLQLGRNTEHWSDKVDIAIDENNMVRIVITYLDPILVEYIVLNYLLNTPYMPNGSSNITSTPMSLDGFDYELSKTLRNLGGRNEMLFAITVTTPFYREQAFNSNVLTVRIPIKELALISGSDMRVVPIHDDHILEENIDITHGPVSGIVGYPLAVLSQEQCIWIADAYTTTLTLDVPRIFLGTTEFGSQFWSIPYRSLVMQDNTQPSITYNGNYTNPISDLEKPPTPNWKPNAETDDTIWSLYWEQMGRYLWNQVITESHH